MTKLIDLSMMIEEGMQTFAAPWHPFCEITQLGRHGIENRETRKLTIGTHCGTHIDAPPGTLLRMEKRLKKSLLSGWLGQLLFLIFLAYPNSMR